MIDKEELGKIISDYIDKELDTEQYEYYNSPREISEMVLGDFMDYCDAIESSDKMFARNKERVGINGNYLQYVKDQTQEICMIAVQQCGGALEFVEEQTLEICLAAVKHDAYYLKYVKEPFVSACRGYIDEKSK